MMFFRFWKNQLSGALAQFLAAVDYNQVKPAGVDKNKHFLISLLFNDELKAFIVCPAEPLRKHAMKLCEQHLYKKSQTVQRLLTENEALKDKIIKLEGGK